MSAGNIEPADSVSRLGGNQESAPVLIVDWRRHVKWLFSLGVCVFLLVLTELGLRVLEGPLDSFTGESLAFSYRAFHPFERDHERWVETAHPPERGLDTGEMPAQTFPEEKRPGVTRVICMGESAATGYPYGVGLSFSTHLSRELAERYPHRRWEVINAAKVNLTSQRLLALLPQVLELKPDVVVLYSGNNEALNGALRIARVTSTSRSEALDLGGVRAALAEASGDGRSRLWRKIKNAYRSWRGMNSVRRRLQLANLEAFDELERRTRLAYLENLAHFVERAHLAHAEVVLVTSPINLRWPVTGPSVLPPPEATVDLVRDMERGRAFIAAGDGASAVAALNGAVEVAAGFAPAHFELARAYELTGNLGEARRHYGLAKKYEFSAAMPHSWDAMNDATRRVAREGGAVLADAAAAFEGSTGIPPRDRFSDYCHPSPEGHVLLAHTVADAMQRVRLSSAAAPGPDAAPPAQNSSDDDHRFLGKYGAVGSAELFEIWLHLWVGLESEAEERWDRLSSRNWERSGTWWNEVAARMAQVRKAPRDHCLPPPGSNQPSSSRRSDGLWVFRMALRDLPRFSAPVNEEKKWAEVLVRLKVDGDAVYGVGADVLTGFLHGDEACLESDGPVEHYGLARALVRGRVSDGAIEGTVRSAWEDSRSLRGLKEDESSGRGSTP